MSEHIRPVGRRDPNELRYRDPASARRLKDQCKLQPHVRHMHEIPAH